MVNSSRKAEYMKGVIFETHLVKQYGDTHSFKVFIGLENTVVGFPDTKLINIYCTQDFKRLLYKPGPDSELFTLRSLSSQMKHYCAEPHRATIFDFFDVITFQRISNIILRLIPIYQHWPWYVRFHRKASSQL